MSSLITRTYQLPFLWSFGLINSVHVISGIMACPLDQLTDDGYDMQFGTNVLGHYLLTKLLLPTLLSTAKQAGEARVINTSSFAHLIGPKGSVEWDTLKPEESGKDWASRRKLGPAGLYNQSKCVRSFRSRIRVICLTQNLG